MDGAQEARGGSAMGRSRWLLGTFRVIGTYTDRDAIGTCTQERLGGASGESTAQGNRACADQLGMDLSEDAPVRATLRHGHPHLAERDAHLRANLE